MSSFLYARTTGDDEEIKRLYGLIEETFYQNPPEGLNYVYQLEQVARRKGNIRYQAYAKAKIVEYYYPMFDNDSVFIVAKNAEDFARRNKEYRYLFVVQQTIIQRYANEGRFLFGLEKASAMLEDTQRFGGSEERARAVAALANLYKHLERYEESVEHYRESLRLMEAADIGLENPLVLENFRELAFVCTYLKQYNQTLLYVDSMRISITLAEESGMLDDSESLFIAECLSAKAFSELGELDKAATALTKMDSFNSTGFPRSFRLLRFRVLIYYLQARGEYMKAYIVNEELLGLAKQFGLVKLQSEQLFQKANLLSLLGRSAEAVSVYKEAFEEQKRSEIARYNQQVNELSALYEVDKMEAQLRVDALRIRIFRNQSLALAVLIILLGVILTLVARHSRRMRMKNRILVRQMNEQERLTMELTNRDVEVRRYHAQSPPSTLSNDNMDELYARVRQVMQEQQPYIDPLFNWKKLVALLETNERLLRATLKKYLGITVSEYITRQRLNYAKLLLSDTDSTIEAIAFDVGFGSRNTFYRLFREHYGLTPDEYRKASMNL